MKKILLVALVLGGFCNVATAVEFTKLTDAGVLCRAVIIEEGLVVYKDNKLLRGVALKNNLGQFPEETSLTQNCDVVALYPEYENGSGQRFQNIFINGKWLKDLPVITQ